MMDTTADTMAYAYLRCALWAELDQSDDSGGYPLDDTYSVDDVDALTWARAVNECQAFLWAVDGLETGLSAEQLGHDLWLTRNRHGTGFWDRGIGEVGDTLTRIAHAMGERTILPTDEGLVSVD